VASRADGVAAGTGRDERSRRPALPRLGAAVRSSLSDYYFHSSGLVPANVVWGAGTIALLIIGFAWPIGGLLLLPSLALPTAAIFRIAARIVRIVPDVGLRDVLWAYRHDVVPTVALGAAIVAIGLVLATNLVSGIALGSPGGPILATLAAWGLVGLWCGAIVAWPLLVDPARTATPLGDRLRLAGALLLVDPIRFGALGILVALVTVVSTILTAAILTVSVSFIALLACRTVYPVADRLQPVPDGSRP
jgi:uncharacterized membrane protein YesL